MGEWRETKWRKMSKRERTECEFDRKRVGHPSIIAAPALSGASNRWGVIEERADTPLQSISTHYLGSLVRSAPSAQTETIVEGGGAQREHGMDIRERGDAQTHSNCLTKERSGGRQGRNHSDPSSAWRQSAATTRSGLPTERCDTERTRRGDVKKPLLPAEKTSWD